MDEKAVIAALRTIRGGVDSLITALGVGEPVEEADQEQREIDLMREFDQPNGHGLTQQQASRACKRHGFKPQQVGAWVRGDWIEVRQGRRYLSSRSYEWLADQGVDVEHAPAAAQANAAIR